MGKFLVVWSAIFMYYAADFTSATVYEEPSEDAYYSIEYYPYQETIISNSGSEISYLIINGETVVPSDKYPWMVSLTENSGKKFCGGALISSTYILTAAHCLYLDGALMKMQVGKCTNYFLSTEAALLSASEIKIEFAAKEPGLYGLFPIHSYVKHPDYIAHLMTYDIGLVKLKTPVKFSQLSKQIRIPRRGMVTKQDSLIVTGWGETEKGPTNVLFEARTRAVDNSVCECNSKDPILCLIGIKNQGPCYGDSGAPAVLMRGGNYYVVGIVSHGDIGCLTSKPALYTDVATFSEWISDVTFGN